MGVHHAKIYRMRCLISGRLFPLYLLLILACADSHITSPAATAARNGSAGILQGKVTIGPLCPVESKDQPCEPSPSLFTSHKLVILNQKGEQVVQVDISGSGDYKTELNSGSYSVDYTPRDIGIPGSFHPPSIEVNAGETTTLDIHIDTGIR
jgi:hypothetical protein